MTRKQQTTPKQPSFPRRCGACGEKDSVHPATISHTSKIKHEGRLHEVTVPDLHVFKCSKCDEVLFGNEADEQIAAALRAKLGLLTPEQIKENREKLWLRQKDLAEHLGTAEETISRWESGLMIQSRAMDNLLRLYFTLPDARTQLAQRTSICVIGSIRPDQCAIYYVPSCGEDDWPTVTLHVPRRFSTFDESTFKRPEVRDLLDGVASLIGLHTTVVSSFGSILKSYETIARKVSDDFNQMHLVECDWQKMPEYRHLRRLQMFTEHLVVMRDKDRDLLLRSILPLTHLHSTPDSDRCLARIPCEGI